jgi:hypothetical protein
MAVATSGYMAVIIDFSGLVAARRQADPGANRSGFLEVVRPLNGCAEGGCGDRTDAGNGHKDAASLTLARVPDQLASEFGGADANATYRLVGFDTPERGDKARCDDERRLADKATQRLRNLITTSNSRLSPAKRGRTVATTGDFAGCSRSADGMLGKS